MTGERRSYDRHSGPTTSLRLPPELLDRLRAEAEARDLSMTYLVRKAVEEFLDRLIPVDEWKLTKDP